jgi:hypothetical protein
MYQRFPCISGDSLQIKGQRQIIDFIGNKFANNKPDCRKMAA